jgi:hypothetical protein
MRAFNSPSNPFNSGFIGGASQRRAELFRNLSLVAVRIKTAVNPVLCAAASNAMPLPFRKIGHAPVAVLPRV